MRLTGGWRAWDSWAFAGCFGIPLAVQLQSPLGGQPGSLPRAPRRLSADPCPERNPAVPGSDVGRAPDRRALDA